MLNRNAARNAARNGGSFICYLPTFISENWAMRSVLLSVTTFDFEHINTKSKTSRKKTLDHRLRKKNWRYFLQLVTSKPNALLSFTNTQYLLLFFSMILRSIVPKKNYMWCVTKPEDKYGQFQSFKLLQIDILFA